MDMDMDIDPSNNDGGQSSASEESRTITQGEDNNDNDNDNIMSGVSSASSQESDSITQLANQWLLQTPITSKKQISQPPLFFESRDPYPTKPADWTSNGQATLSRSVT
ncbi:hypothetical protein PanWU01x14_238780 [Parasponia andersonii]|uniref:Uncharacterized protein n=1 Tax=Parasponia andersonii TaxID=3476 RepID=A0A2P5BHG0_PARAD|nr:hypothetical protein PanWU01x14_238780 [Parasponia andersonii]